MVAARGWPVGTQREHLNNSCGVYGGFRTKNSLTLDDEAGDAVDLLSAPTELLGLSASEAPLEEEGGCACLEDVACRGRGESSLFMSNKLV